MALKRGLIGLDTHMPTPCRGGLRLGNRVFRCWKKEGHGSLDLVGAMAASCDVYFYQLGLRLGLDAIVEDGILMGFRDESGIDLENEVAPIYPASTAYFDRLYGPRHWSPPATTLNFSIGQGENTQTLINMMRFYEALAGDGNAAAALHRATGRRTSRDRLASPRSSSTDSARALIAVVERGTASAQPPHRPRRRRQDRHRTELPRARTTAGSSASRRRTSRELVVGGIMEFAEHGTDGGAVRGADAAPVRPGPRYRRHHQGEGPDRRDARDPGHARRVRSSSTPTRPRPRLPPTRPGWPVPPMRTADAATARCSASASASWHSGC